MQPSQNDGALEELRDALDDAIRRAYCEPILPPVEGEDTEIVRSIARAEIIHSPNRMRHLAGIQAAAWEAVGPRIEGGSSAGETP
jgi:hypothetical protein